MIRIATLIVLMATPAWADECFDTSICTWREGAMGYGSACTRPQAGEVDSCVAHGSWLIGASSTPVTIATNSVQEVPTKCPAGWTLVYVWSAQSSKTVGKCAPVGDLTDPY